MFNNKRTFYPAEIYYNIKFDKIKENLVNICDRDTTYKDYGSTIIIECDNLSISITDIGDIIIYHDDLNEKYLNSLIDKIEKTFKKEISTFSIKH